MAVQRVICVLFATAIVITNVKTAMGRNYYRAAVVEHPPEIKNSRAEQNLRETIDRYELYIKKARSQEVDIIVFPEAGLFGTNFSIFHAIPKENGVVPTDSGIYGEHIIKLSAFARKYALYVAVNILEKYTNSGNITTKYITNLVFDRQGAVVARYRKYNLLGEPVNRTTKNLPVFFTTDFKVRFGIIFGLDILYKQPALALIKEYNVTDFIYSSQWVSELPFLTSPQAQWMWSVGNDVTLLAAGLNDIKCGCSGSGIYRGKNAPVGNLYVFSHQSDWAMLVGNVSIDGQYDHNIEEDECSTKIMPGKMRLPLFRQKELDDMASANIDLPSGNSNVTNEHLETNFKKQLCHGWLCCRFNLTIKYRMSELQVQYKVVVFNGNRTSKIKNTKLVQGVQVCGIILCSNKSISTCGPPAVDGHFPNLGSLKPAVNFTLISISGNFTNNDSNILPNVLLWPSVSNITKSTEFLIDPRLVNFSKADADGIAKLSLEPSKEIITSGIFSRVFTKDFYNDADVPKKNSSAGTVNAEISFWEVSLPVIFYSSLFYLFFIKNNNYCSLRRHKLQ